MEYYIIKVKNLKSTGDDIQSEYISQNLFDHVNNAVISTSEVLVFLNICMGLISSADVYVVTFRHLTKGGYCIQIDYIDGCTTEIIIKSYAENISTSMMNEIFSALNAAGLLFFLPMEEVQNE